MTLGAIFKQIESSEFELQLGVASGFGTFQSILHRSEIYQQLLEAVSSYSLAEKVTARLFELLSERGDPQYAHPHDDAITVYMLAVMEKYPELLEKLLTDEIDPSGLFWTRFAAEKLNETLKIRT